ncbi:MAG TPA: DUF3108 domain-containing protein [Gemmatimonadaceae bacterium]|nr:DUF3108 domain-containing protein [Gemmatimonadaceae bacterium]
MPKLLSTAALAAVLTSPMPLLAQAAVAPAAADTGVWARVPFGVGERLEYQVKFGFLPVGSGAMEVAGIDSVRGRSTWHTVFTVKGGTVFFKVNDRLESWMDVHSLSSLRHVQQLDEGRRERERAFEIFPDRGVFIENGKPEAPTVAAPLDDGSFLYFVRTIPLEVGATYEFDRYFRPDRNPVKIRVLRREHIHVPAGEFDAVVVQPIIKTKGIFSEGGRAEIWLSDDDRHIMLQMKSKLSFGSLNLYLTSYTPATAAPSPAATLGARP